MAARNLDGEAEATSVFMALRISEALLSTEYIYDSKDSRLRAPDYDLFFSLVGEQQN